VIVIWQFLKNLPWQVYAAIALAALFFWFRGHYIHIGIERCETAHKEAQAKAELAAIEQEKAAPVIAQEAHDAVAPIVTERVRIIHDQIKSNPIACDTPYDNIVQQAVREAAASSNHLRPIKSADP
jgi:hypothetical protein